MKWTQNYYVELPDGFISTYRVTPHVYITEVVRGDSHQTHTAFSAADAFDRHERIVKRETEAATAGTQ